MAAATLTRPVTEPGEKSASARERALEIAMAGLDKQFGKGSVMLMSSRQEQKVASISTGILPLDLAIGIGGVPRGRITEIHGPESSGKTTVCQHVIAEAQRAGGTAAFIDVEHALSPEYAQNLGINLKDLLVCQPDSGEEALEIMDALVRSGAIDVIVLDSVAALVPKAEIEGDMGDSHMGLQARLMSQAMRKLNGSISKTNTAAIFINQMREKIGVMYGSPETTPGGRALKFYASVIMDIRRVETIKRGSDAVGNRVKVKVTKNKVASPFRVCEFDIEFSRGVPRCACVLDVGEQLKIVQKVGAWYTYGDVRLGQGRENAKKFLDDNPEVLAAIEGMVRTSSAGSSLLTVAPSTGED